VNSCQQSFRSVASFGYGGQESASKPPQAIFKPLVRHEVALIQQVEILPRAIDCSP
jgi:hypothetical protein